MKYDWNVIIDGYNAAVATIVLLLSTLFGQFWYLFAAFLLFNVLDYLTGWYKSRKLQKESSTVGLTGVIKKLLYWVLIMVAFVCASVLSGLGQDLLDVDLSFLHYMGWFVLASLTINEARSIVENAVEAGINVPIFLTKGLQVAAELIEAKMDVPEKKN